jgi:peptidoglycan biosynthesis protein MviN/MurJ (putative lipid II flippase)
MSGFIGTLVGVIIALIIMGVIWWAIQQLLPLIPLGEPFRKIIYVLMMVILVLVVLWVILVLLGAAGVHVPGPFR